MNARWQVEAVHRFLDRIHGAAQVGPLQPARNHDHPQKIFPADFSLPRKLGNCRQRSECRRVAAATGEHRVTDRFHRSTVILWKTHADGVYPVI